jgi:hypothetical protein
LALASIPIRGQDIANITCIAHSHNRRIELYGASIDSGAVSQLADPLEARSDFSAAMYLPPYILQGGLREEQDPDPPPPPS